MKIRNRDETRRLILKGLRDGLPIGLGYFAVAFSLGITARGAGVSPLEGWVASILNHASAGEYALYALIGAHAAVWEIATVIFVTNMRYLLMSAALSQKMPPEAGFLKRLSTGFTLCGILAGNILPARVVTALSVAIYGMFLAIIIPPTRKNRVLAGLVAAAFACSFAANRLIPSLSEGTRTVILTVGLAAVAAVLFPVKDDDTSAKGEGKEETA